MLRNKKNKRYFKSKKIKWLKRDIPSINGVYHLGPENKYFLTESSLDHIIKGDLSQRTEKNGNEVIIENILKGGLHTYDAWIDFKKDNNKLVHLREYDSRIHNYWYYARELKNKVITLKIPKELFNSKAAGITKIPETYYKSGYLWKTLFPKNKTVDEILSIIDEALYKQDKDESENNILIGYALVNHPFTAMKVRIQCFGNEIKSAFPTWEQPRIGNTGKPYSHSDTIGFTIADSTEFFDDNFKIKLQNDIDKRLKNIDILVNKTFDFILKRPFLNLKNKSLWEKKLKYIGEKQTSQSITSLKEYLFSPLVCKEAFIFQLNAFNSIDNYRKNMQLYNSISISRNTLDILSVIFHYDNKNRTNHFIDCVLYILKNKTISAGALDLLYNKVLNNLILDFILNYHDYKAIPSYLNTLATSPSRLALYTDFDVINSCYKRELDPSSTEIDTIYATGGNIELKRDYFIIFLLYQLGENYLLLKQDMQDELIKNIMESQGYGFNDMIEDFMNMYTFLDIDFFPEKFNNLCKLIIDENIDGLNSSSIETISKDYFRIQTAQRFKTVLREPYYRYKSDDFNFGTSEFIEGLATKHERLTNVFLLKQFLDDNIKLANYINEQNLVDKLKGLKRNVWTERPPTFKNNIPNYIKHWIHEKEQNWVEE